MTETAPTAESSSDRHWGLALHLSALAGIVFAFTFANVVVPLVIWTLKREDRPYLDHQGKEVVNFQLSLSIVLLVLWCVRFTGFAWIAYYVLAGAGILVTVLGGAAAHAGRAYRYPVTFRFFE